MSEKRNLLLDYEKPAQAEQLESSEQIRPEQLYAVLKTFDHIRDYTDQQLESIYKTIYADLIKNRFSKMDQAHLKRNESELKDARHEYKMQKEKGNDPLPVYEELTADDLIQFVYQNGIGNKGIDLMEVVSDKFKRLELNVEEGGREEFEMAKQSITPELILLAKIQLEQYARENNQNQDILPPDSKLNLDAVQNVDAVGLAFQLKAMPNVKSAKDLLNWGYTSREAIYLFDWSTYSQSLLDPEGTGSLSFGTEEEMEIIAAKLAEETEKIYPQESNVKLQKQAMLRRMMKYINHEDVLLYKKGPESIGLAYAEREQDRMERIVHLIDENLYQDTALEPEETRNATRNFREIDLSKISQSILEIKHAKNDESQLASIAELIKILGGHYDLFNSIQKDEVGLPELYDQSIRQIQSEKAAERVIEFIRLSAGFDLRESEIAEDLKKYMRLLVELDHNASLRRMVFQKGAEISNKVFTNLELQEKELSTQYANEVRELDKAIGATRIRPSERIRKIDLVDSKAQQELQKTKQQLSGEQPVISKELELAQKRMNDVISQREDLQFLLQIFEEKLGINA